MNSEHPTIDSYRNIFVNRYDVYAVQTRTGSYFVERAPITPRVIATHLGGRTTVGLYAIAPDGNSLWTVLDADGSEGLERLQQASRKLEKNGIPSALEKSRRGGHLWCFFDPIPAKAARRLITGVVGDLSELELYPKQDQLREKQPLGSLVRAPLGIHRLSGQRYPFVDPYSLAPVSRTIAGQIGFLHELGRLTNSQVAMKLAELLENTQKPAQAETAPPLRQLPSRVTYSPIEQVKQQIGDPVQFITRFVELDPSGKGHCPFHPPDNHPSFSVNKRTGRWTCFHEYDAVGKHYLSGDSLDFYMRYTGLNHKDAVRKLLG